MLQGQYKDEVINFRGNDVITTDGSLISGSCDSDFQLSMRDGNKLVTISVTDYDVAKSEVDESMNGYDESNRNYDVVQNCDAQSYLTWDDAQSTILNILGNGEQGIFIVIIICTQCSYLFSYYC